MPSLPAPPAESVGFSLTDLQFAGLRCGFGSLTDSSSWRAQQKPGYWVKQHNMILGT